MVHHIDATSDKSPAFFDADIGVAVVMGGKARIIDLKEKAGIHDRLVFLVHGVGDREEIFRLRPVDAVLVIERDIVWRKRGYERLLDGLPTMAFFRFAISV